MDIVIVVGSLREQSLNKQLALTLQERYEGRLNISIADIGALPHYDQDDELDPPAVVKDFKASIARADGVIITTPEYNWSIPGVLKNALDWASRVDKVFAGKPVLPMGVTPGMLGTVRAQMHLREILSSAGMQARVLPPGGNEVLINFARDKFDPEHGRLVHDETIAFLDDVVDKFVALIEDSAETAARV